MSKAFKDKIKSMEMKRENIYLVGHATFPDTTLLNHISVSLSVSLFLSLFFSFSLSNNNQQIGISKVIPLKKESIWKISLVILIQREFSPK